VTTSVASQNATSPARLVVINAGTSEPSSSRLLATRVAEKARRLLAEHGMPAEVQVIDLGPLSGEIGQALLTGQPQGRLLEVIQQLTDVEGVIAATPIYKAGVSGLFKSFVDILDNDLLIAVPVVMVATGGSARHALVAEDHMRPLFAFMRSLAAPTAVFAAPEDWGDAALGKRVDRAATELAAMVRSGVRRLITDQAWGGYPHQWGSPTRQGTDLEIDLGSDLMRLATGGNANGAAS
jgi:FMN reductase